MQQQGYIKLHRKMLENPICMKDADHFALWVYILLQCTHTETSKYFAGNKIILLPGQFITGRDKIAKDLKINRSKVERMLKEFCSKSEQQIEQQTTPHGRLITVLNWTRYQNSEQPDEQQVSNKRATSEQQVSTNKNVKNDKNVKNENNIYTPKPSVSVAYKNFIDFLNEKTGKKFRYTNKKAATQLQARLREGYSREDFENAIVNCKNDTFHKENNLKYLTPEFITRSDKLEKYLNSVKPAKKSAFAEIIKQKQEIKTQ